MKRSSFFDYRSSCITIFPLLLGCSALEPGAQVGNALPVDSGASTMDSGAPTTDDGAPGTHGGVSAESDNLTAANDSVPGVNGSLGGASGGASAVDPDHCVTSGALHDVRAYMADEHGAELVATGPLYGAQGPASVQKLDAACNPVWTYPLPPSDTLWCFRLAVDASGNVVVAGSLSAASESDAELRSGGALFLMKLDPAGHLLWRAVSALGGRLSRIVLAPAGDIVAFGRAQDTRVGDKWDLVVRYDQSGHLRWQKPFGDERARVADLAVDAAGAVLVAGRFVTPFDFGGGVLSPVHADSDLNSFDAFLAKYDAAGHPLWSKRFGDEQSQSLDRVLVDAAGGVTVRGRGNGLIDLGGGPLSLGDDGAFGAGFDGAGHHVWSAVDTSGS